MGTRYIDVIDEDGKQTRIVEITSRIRTSNLDSPTETWLQGASEFRTLRGARVNERGEEFEEVGTGRRYRRI